MSAFDESAWLHVIWQPRVAVEGRLVESVRVQTNDTSREDAGRAAVLESLSSQSKWLRVYCPGGPVDWSWCCHCCGLHLTTPGNSQVKVALRHCHTIAEWRVAITDAFASLTQQIAWNVTTQNVTMHRAQCRLRGYPHRSAGSVKCRFWWKVKRSGVRGFIGHSAVCASCVTESNCF